MSEKHGKNVKRKRESGSLILDLIYTIVGSTPMIILVVICYYLLIEDYKINNNNFWAQSKFFSNTKPHEYFQNQTCIDQSNDKICSDTKFCGRFFTDYLLTKDEARTLLKIAKDGFSNGKNLDALTNSFNYETGILIENDKTLNIINEYDDSELQLYQNVKRKVLEEIKDKFHVTGDLKSVGQTYFTRLSNASELIDFKKEPFNTFCYTTLVMLNSFVIDVEGSRIVFHNHIGTKLSIQPRPGRLIAFTKNNEENEVYLEKIRKNFSHILIAGYTCQNN